ncbi:MAG: Ig-like domain-containing protein [Gammaproteobacteria bacterium]|nr:Ig-like domain-containing protein [Gammaproteobacteria bacterium]
MTTSRWGRTCLAALFAAVAGMAAGSATAQYQGPFDDELGLNDAEQEQRNRQSLRRILGSIGTHNFLIPFGFVPEPFTSYAAETSMIGLDYGLKFMRAVLYAPPDLELLPDSPDGCTYTLVMPRTNADYTNNLGFTPRLADDYLLIPDDFVLKGRKGQGTNVPVDFGVLGVPEIYHANTDVTLTVEALRNTFIPDPTLPGAEAPEHAPGRYELEPGVHTFVWNAETRMFPFYDTILPSVMLPVMAAAEWKFAKILKDVRIAQDKAIKNLVIGSAKDNADELAAALRWINLKVRLVEFINKRLNSNALDYLKLGAEIVDIDDLTDRMGTGFATVSRSRTQTVTIWDTFAPTISTTEPVRPVEASDIGGVATARILNELMGTIVASDRCDRPVVVSNDAPEFLPLGDTLVTWTVRDPGPALPGTDRDGDGVDDAVNIATVTQTVRVVDTQAPILVPPPGLVTESDAPLVIADVNLGQPLVADLADIEPDVTNASPDPDGIVEVDTRTVVSWSAADDATPPNVETGQQLVTVKTPGTNSAPIANDVPRAITRTSVEVPITLSANDADRLPYSHDPGGERIADPLTFRIGTPPARGEFVSPLLPFFINDYRTDQQGGLYDDFQAIEDAGDPAEAERLRTAYIEAARSVDSFAVARFLNDEYCLMGLDAPVDFVYEPQFVQVTDDGEQFFFDYYVQCNPNVDSTYVRLSRISRWDRNDNFLGHVQIRGTNGNPVSGAEATFFIDREELDGDPETNENFLNFVLKSRSGIPSVSINRCPAQLTDTSPTPGACESQDFGPVDGNNASPPGQATSDPENAFADLERESVYVVAGSYVAVFDFRRENPADPSSPRFRQNLVGWLTNDAGSAYVLDDGVCFGPGNPVFPDSLTIDGAGNIYVTDIGCDRIHKFTAPTRDEAGELVLGEYVGWMGRCNGSNNQACDTGKQRTRGFTCTVAAACTVPGGIESGSEPGQFSSPAFLATDPNDILYVADYGNQRVQRFDTDGTFAGQAESSGNGINAASEGGFVLGNMGPPKHVSVNSKNFFVVDQSENFVHVFETSPFTEVTDSSAVVTYVSNFDVSSVTDTFTFVANDGLVDSNATTVTIDVQRNYRQPLPEAQAVDVNEDGSVVIVLRGTDPDGITDRDIFGLDELVFEIARQPASGTLTPGGDPGDAILDAGTEVWTYTPDPDFFGSDSFSFTVTDAYTGLDTDPATGTEIVDPYGAAEPAEVGIDVASKNDIPIVLLDPPERAAAGFPVMIDGTLFDDFGSNHRVRMFWGDGTIENGGDAVFDDGGTPDDSSDDTFGQTGVLFSADGLEASGTTSVNAIHTYATTGPKIVTLCLKDMDNLESCRSTGFTVEQLAVVGADIRLDVETVKDGIVFGGTISVVNAKPEAGVTGLDAENVTLEFELPDELVLLDVAAAQGTCSVAGQLLSCDYGTLANGATADLDFTARGLGTLLYDAAIELYAEVRSTTPLLEEPALGGAGLEIAAIAVDRDDDGLPNIFEATYGVTSPDADDDGDGLTNLEEFEARTSPVDADTDGDGVPDGVEVADLGSDPLAADSDLDGIADADEINVYGTNPARSDTDDDGLPDDWEIGNGFDPLVADSDGDSDGDGLSDRDEFANESNYLDPDTDGDTLPDGDEVFVHRSDPTLVDTDEDGLDDPGEVAAATKADVPDTDNDGLYDGREVLTTFTSPHLDDTDRDGLPDGFEDSTGRNPLVADYALAAGGLSTCAMNETGVECWGRNDFGQAPASVAGLVDPVALTVGFVHACSIDQSGSGARRVACWGNNDFGQRNVPPLNRPVQIAAGGYHTCVIDEDAFGNQSVVCWGRDNFQQVSSLPVDIEQPERLVSAISGSSSCVLDRKATGPELVCWGQYNNANTAIPAVTGNLQALAHGSEHACIVEDDERLCWGLNDDGQAPPTPVASTAIELSLGGFHSCSLTPTDNNSYVVDCAGRDVDGQATPSSRLVDPIQLASGSHHTCALDGGQAICWGANPGFNFGQAPISRFLDIDPDGDGLSTAREISFSDSDPLDADSDRDGLTDAEESPYETSPSDDDTDDDGLSDADEVRVWLTDPLNDDSDGDGMPDGFEADHGLQPLVADADGDLDGDGLSNGDEFTEETDPSRFDTDDDGLGDGQEIALALDPNEVDSDGDGARDGWELDHGFDPLNDLDGALDGDLDGLSNFDEFMADTNPGSADTDGDGIPDGYEVDNDLDPLVDDAAGDLDRDGLDNLSEYLSGAIAYADDIPPVLTVPGDLLADSIGPLTDVGLGIASASDTRDGAVTPVPSDSGPFAPGPHEITWTAMDLSGNVAEALQFVGIVPLVEFAVDQIVAEGQSAIAAIMLNGPAVEYPVQVNYTVGGDATNPEDHNAADGSVLIESGTAAGVPIDIVGDPIFEGDESFTLAFAEIVNAVPGAQRSHTLTIAQSNVRPTASITAEQAGRSTTIVLAAGGPLTISADVVDPNVGDTHSLDWTASDPGIVDALSPNAPSYSIDTATLNPGLYRLVLQITDDGQPAESNRVETVLKVVAQAPALDGGLDSDGDGVDDEAEGFGDADNDRIPDYLDDSRAAANVIALSDDGFLLQTQPGLGLRLGETAFSLQGGASVAESDVAEDPEAGFPNGVADFEVLGVEPGSTALVVMPLRHPLPANATYRKYIDNAWQDFVVDASNTVASAAGTSGACPAPGSTDYRAGLNPGDACVQLQLQDGGPNDGDGAANGIIRDPGGVAVPVGVRFAAGAAPNRTVLAGTRNVVMLAFSLISDSGDAELDAISLTGTGDGDKAGIRVVRLVVDENDNGTVDVGEPVIGQGVYPANGNTLDLLLPVPFDVSPGRTAFLVTYDF